MYPLFHHNRLVLFCRRRTIQNASGCFYNISDDTPDDPDWTSQNSSERSRLRKIQLDAHRRNQIEFKSFQELGDSQATLIASDPTTKVERNIRDVYISTYVYQQLRNSHTMPYSISCSSAMLESPFPTPLQNTRK